MARSEFFIDTSAWFPITLKKHPDHKPFAAELRRRVVAGERVVTTNLVIAETHALLLIREHRAAALDFARGVRETPNVVVYSDAELEEAAMADWIERFDDQNISLADAVSFTVMHDRGIKSALTLDRHFATAGFEMVTGSRA